MLLSISVKSCLFICVEKEKVLYLQHLLIITDMNNHLVIFSNIKGGVGKTTLCAMFASYLAKKNEAVAVVDADLQASLFRHRSRDLQVYSDEEPSFRVITTNDLDGTPETMAKLMDKLKLAEGWILVDCPGNLNDKALAPILKAADYAVIPISYDEDTIDATGIFIKTLKKNSKAQPIFVPNRIDEREKKAVEMEQRKKTIATLGTIGTVTPRIKQSVVVKRYSTMLPLDNYQFNAVTHAFDKIIEIIKNK